MKKPIKRVATIHDLCGIGKAALTNVIPVLSSLGIEVCPIPTMILSTHTGGFGTPNIIKLDGYINKAIEHYKSLNINFEGIFIGYLGSNENIEDTIESIELIKNDDSLIVFDPIFADNGCYYRNFDKSYSDNLTKIMKYANIITPNFTEACILSQEKIMSEVSEDELLLICRKLNRKGCNDIVITSVPLKNKNKIGIAVYHGKDDLMEIIIRDKLQNSYPGTGDIFTSALIGLILNGLTLREGVQKACVFVERCIIESSKHDYPIKEGVLLEPVLNEFKILL
jgi:pyridoxine kinase